MTASSFLHIRTYKAQYNESYKPDLKFKALFG